MPMAWKIYCLPFLGCLLELNNLHSLCPPCNLVAPLITQVFCSVFLKISWDALSRAVFLYTSKHCRHYIFSLDSYVRKFISVHVHDFFSRLKEISVV